MSQLEPVLAAADEAAEAVMMRKASLGESPMVMADIYQAAVNMAIWQRSLSPALQALAERFVTQAPDFSRAMTVSPELAYSRLSDELGKGFEPLAEDMAELIDMFSELFELSRVGLRIGVLGQAMCPKFHVDKVPCRLITTYQGVATQWLTHEAVDRRKLGAGSAELSDSESGLYLRASDIQTLHAGDVALLKGERWMGNEGAGLVHRSPQITEQQPRLLMTLDFA
ncbi:MAG: DUF1826 domain-containing protein [Pseudomonadota bacterium]|nr:DUF1826 domain-containing protein [Pseudomonadota bacterium]